MRIDHRTPYATPTAERLPKSARKPVRRINHEAYKAPGYCETKTSTLRVGTERNPGAPATTSNECLALSRMFPNQRRRMAGRMAAQLTNGNEVDHV